jgi:hypothetical protein
MSQPDPGLTTHTPRPGTRSIWARNAGPYQRPQRRQQNCFRTGIQHRNSQCPKRLHGQPIIRSRRTLPSTEPHTHAWKLLYACRIDANKRELWRNTDNIGSLRDLTRHWIPAIAGCCCKAPSACSLELRRLLRVLPTAVCPPTAQTRKEYGRLAPTPWLPWTDTLSCIPNAVP